MRIVCENAGGQTIDFSAGDSPLEIVALDGFAEADYTVHTAQSSGQDGETYTGAQAQKRNPVITGYLQGNFRWNRDRIYAFFPPRSEGLIYYYEDDADAGRKARYYVESIKIDNYGFLRSGVISLLCPDPRWYALEDELTSFASLQGGIIWPLELTDPMEVTTLVKTIINTIRNDSAVVMGLTITFRSSGTVTNPSMLDVGTGKLLKVSTTMHAGDKIVITTGDGGKRARMMSGGVTTNINNLLAYPPAWLQAQPGDNIYRYDADDGIDALSASIQSTPAYWGA